MELKATDQVYVNSKWYFDVKSIDGQTIKVRIKYFEGVKTNLYLYKTIKLPLELFKNIEQYGFIVKVTVKEYDLKQQIGGLIDRLVKEPDITKIVEDMGAVSSPGINATPGMTGSAGSGDIGSFGGASTMPSNEFGLQIVPKANRKKIKKMLNQSKSAKNSSDNIIKTPVLNLFKENLKNDELHSDNDYKMLIYQFLDYPTDNDMDIKFINIVNDLRPEFLDTCSQRIKQYFKDLYNTNKTLIKKKCSKWFINNMLILGDITETE